MENRGEKYRIMEDNWVYIANDGGEVLDHNFGGLLILSEFLSAAEQEGCRKLHVVCDTGTVTSTAQTTDTSLYTLYTITFKILDFNFYKQLFVNQIDEF